MTTALDSRADLAVSVIPAVTAAQMAKVDRLAVDDDGIDILQMME